MTALHKPSREEFRSLAARHTVVPVWTELLADLETPVTAFAKLVGEADGFLLESVEHGERWGRFSFVGWDPVMTMTLCDGVVAVEGPEHVDVPRDRGILAAIEAVLAAYDAPELGELPPLSGGLIGYLGYDVIREVERLPNVPPSDRQFPDAVMSMIGSLAAFDHWLQRITLIESVPIHTGDGDLLDVAYEAAVDRLGRSAAALGRALPYEPVTPPDPDEAPPSVVSSMPDGGYQLAVSAAKEHIVAGDIFQVVLAQRFDFDLDADPFDVYRVLRQINPSPYMYFLRGPEVTVVGSSPEPMVKLVDGTVISRPIAGTRKRGSTDEHDRRLAAELAEHPKERAEHVMLVDLARNDVGRVSQFGTVHVDELLTLERYSHVMHLTSQVSGKLVAGLGPIDVLRATLPAGTVSGAPKVRAMEIIDELEPIKRGPYAGVVGYVDWRGNLDTAIAIRTMFVHDGAASVQAGPASSPTPIPTTRTSSAATRPLRYSPPFPQRAACGEDAQNTQIRNRMKPAPAANSMETIAMARSTGSRISMASTTGRRLAVPDCSAW